MITIPVAGTELQLLPERAAYWPEQKTLFVADLHWGKAAAFRSHLIPVPHGTTEGDFRRLSEAVRRTGCRRIVMLGDAIHAREGRSNNLLEAGAEWRAAHSDLEILLVRGNHDRRAGDPPASFRIECVNAPVVEPPFVFLHHPEPSGDGYALAGHVHPAISLRGKGRQRAVLPCFWFAPAVGTLPAFGSFCGQARIHPEDGDRVFVLAEDEVIPVTGL